MSTRARIRIKNNGKEICSKYYSIDGHIDMWAPILIIALNQTTPQKILVNKQLLSFMCDGYGERDSFLDYLCEIDISNDIYQVTIYGYKKKLLFEGTLEEFANKYYEIE